MSRNSDRRYQHTESLYILGLEDQQNKATTKIWTKWWIQSVKGLLSLESYQVTELRIYRVTELQSYRVTELLSYRITELQSYRVTELQSNRVTDLHNY